MEHREKERERLFVTSGDRTVTAIQWNFNETGMQDGNGTWRPLCYKGTIYIREMTNNVLLN